MSKVTIVGAIAEIVKVWLLDVPPPGAGLNTVTWAVPAVAISVAGIVAVSRETEPNAVVRSLPFHRTVELETKLLPFTVNVNPAPPGAAEFGLRLVVVGTGLLAVLLEYVISSIDSRSPAVN